MARPRQNSDVFHHVTESVQCFESKIEGLGVILGRGATCRELQVVFAQDEFEFDHF